MSPRRSSYYGNSAIRNTKELQFEELDRADFLDLKLLAYTVADGDPEDIATTVERRLAIFRKEGFPEDPYPDMEKKAATTGGYYGYWDGLEHAEIDEPLDTIKERDEIALEHKRESENLLDPNKSAWTAQMEKVSFEDFLNAVEKVKTDEDDEEAWATIDRWRTRRVQGEKVI